MHTGRMNWRGEDQDSNDNPIKRYLKKARVSCGQCHENRDYRRDLEQNRRAQAHLKSALEATVDPELRSRIEGLDSYCRTQCKKETPYIDNEFDDIVKILESRKGPKSS